MLNSNSRTGPHQFATHNGRGSIYAFSFRRLASLAVPTVVARYLPAPRGMRATWYPQGPLAPAIGPLTSLSSGGGVRPRDLTGR
jgi:hypothetical protein